MPLLHLPLEVFQNIIEAYVADSGVLVAWQSRLTCKTFANAIQDEVFGKQPVETYLKDRAHKNLLKKGMVIYLQCRASALYSAHDILPAIIRNSIDLFIRLTNKPPGAKQEYLLPVSKIVDTYTLHETLNLVVRPTDRMFRTYTAEGDIQLALPIAVALGDANLVRKIRDIGADLWKPTAAFGLPLRVAIKAGNIAITKLVLELSEDKHTTVPINKRALLLSSYISDSWHVMRRGLSLGGRGLFAFNANVLTILLEWFCSHLGRPTVQIGEVIMKWSLQRRNIRLFETALALGTTQPLKQAYAHTFLNDIPESHPRCRQYLKLLLDKDMIKGNTNYLKPRYHNSLLSCAISTGDIDLVRKTLDIGCDPNGVLPEPVHHHMKTWPLGDAIKLGDVDIIKLLLERGADPDGCSDPGLDSGVVNHLLCLSAKPEVRKVLVTAIYQKIVRQGRNYEVPPHFNRYVDAIFDLVSPHEIPREALSVLLHRYV